VGDRGDGFYYACQLGALVLLAKFASPAIQGEYFFALAIATRWCCSSGWNCVGRWLRTRESVHVRTYRALRRRMMLAAAVVLGGYLVWDVVRRARPAARW